MNCLYVVMLPYPYDFFLTPNTIRFPFSSFNSSVQSISKLLLEIRFTSSNLPQQHLTLRLRSVHRFNGRTYSRVASIVYTVDSTDFFDCVGDVTLLSACQITLRKQYKLLLILEYRCIYFRAAIIFNFRKFWTSQVSQTLTLTLSLIVSQIKRNPKYKTNDIDRSFLTVMPHKKILYILSNKNTLNSNVGY